MIPIQVPTGEISNEEANELADEILLRGEFLGSREPGRFARAVDRVIGWIGDALDRIFSTIFGGAGSGAGVTLAYILLAVAIVVLLLAIWRAIKGRTPKDDEADDPGARIVFDELVDPNELRTDLAARTASEDWRGAVVTGFRPGGFSSRTETSICPYCVRLSERGIGVAVITSMSAASPFAPSSIRCATPNRCCSSTIARRRS